MAQIKSPVSSSALLLLLLLISSAPTADALSYFGDFSSYKSIISLSHSLLTRVSNLRASRGDIAGASRAKAVAEHLERGLGLGFWRLAWSAGWDYVRNYAWRDFDYRDLSGVVSELSELMGFLGELTRSKSEVERAAWIARNYGKVLRVAKSAVHKLLKVFRRSGVLKEVVETVEKEVVDGGLLKDCLELGGNDFIGLAQIIKDLASQYYYYSSTSNDSNGDL